MNDDMDVYLSRCLKNWAADNKPPVSSRSSLLRAAKSKPVQRDRQIVHAMVTICSLFFGREWVYAEEEWQFGPHLNSRNWSYHISSNVRLAYY
jgi:hypothetical protein